MNPWQLAQQIKSALVAKTWPSGSASAVFGPRSVFVYAGAQPADEELPPAFPFALVSLGSALPDPDHPDLIAATFSITAVVEVAGDPLGEFAVIGGARADLGRSEGAGIGEVTAQVRAAVQALTAYDGTSIILSGSGVSSPGVVGRGRQLAAEEFQLSALCTSAPFFAAPWGLRHTAGAWTWTGVQCSRRFDFVRYRLGYVAGDTPVATPEEMDAIIYTGVGTSFIASSTTNRVYQVFADYNARGTGLDLASSNGSTTSSFRIVL